MSILEELEQNAEKLKQERKEHALAIEAMNRLNVLFASRKWSVSLYRNDIGEPRYAIKDWQGNYLNQGGPWDDKKLLSFYSEILGPSPEKVQKWEEAALACLRAEQEEKKAEIEMP